MSEDPPENLQDHLLRALAGAIMLRDRLAEAGDNEGTHLALLTVSALNGVFDALSVEHPRGPSQMLPRERQSPVNGFAASSGRPEAHDASAHVP